MMESGVIELATVRQPKEQDRRVRRLAMQIAVQLPEDEKDALAVLRYAKRLIRDGGAS